MTRDAEHAVPPRFAPFLAALDAVPAADDAEVLFDPATRDGALRRRNLLRYLELLHRGGADHVLIGEAPGWRGMTITGVPFTGIRELTARPGLISGSSDGDGFEVPADPAVEWEAAARDFWAAMAGGRGPVPLSWPIFPHHPHVPGRRHSNRPPRPAEVRAGAAVVPALLAAFPGIRPIAVGRVAQRALLAAGIEAAAVRHPARGGARLFAEQVLALGVGGTARAADRSGPEAAQR